MFCHDPEVMGLHPSWVKLAGAWAIIKVLSNHTEDGNNLAQPYGLTVTLNITFIHGYLVFLTHNDLEIGHF